MADVVIKKGKLKNKTGQVLYLETSIDLIKNEDNSPFVPTTTENVDTIIEQKGYQTSQDVEKILATKNYQNENQVNSLIDSRSYITEASLSDYAKKKDIPTDNKTLVNGAGYITKDALNGYAKSSDLPTNTSELNNDSGFLTEIPLEYVTDSELVQKGYQTEANVESIIAGKNFAVKSEIPTSTGDLINNSGFISSIPAEYITEVELEAKDYKNTSEVNQLIDNKKLIPLTQKGSHNGIAELDSNGKVPSSQLPSYVDDVLEYETRSAFPKSGESGKIYVDKSTNITYRWSGSTYIIIGGDLTLGETSSTAYAGDKGKKNAEDISNLQSTKADKSEIPTQTGDLTNNSGFITSASLAPYALSSEIPTNNAQLKNGAGYITSNALTLYAKKEDLPKNVSDLTNDAGYISGIPQEYITESELLAKDYQTESDVNVIIEGKNYALKSEVPTDTSDLTNNANFIKQSALDGYATESWVIDQKYLKDHQSLSNYYTREETNNEINAAALLKADKNQVEAQLALKEDAGVAYSKKDANATFAYKSELPNLVPYATKEWVNENKAQKETTLSGYGITDAYTKSQTYSSEQIDSMISSVYRVKGSKQTFDLLPLEGNIIGDVWNVIETDMNYVWTGAAWDALGTTRTIDLKDYYTITQVDEKLDLKANVKDVYSKSEIEKKRYVSEESLNSKNFATQSWVTDKNYLVAADISGKADRSELPKDLGDLTNNAGYLKTVPSEYITELELAEKGYQNALEVNAIIEGKNYAAKSDIKTDTKDLTNGAGYITASSLEGYATQEWIEGKGYQTALEIENTISKKGYQTASQVNLIVEGKGYQTGPQVESAITGKGYQTSAQVELAITNKGYQNAQQVDKAITSKGYQTSSQVESAITTKGYQTSSQVEVAITGKGYQTEPQVKSIVETTNKNMLSKIIYNGGFGTNNTEGTGLTFTKDFCKYSELILIGWHEGFKENQKSFNNAIVISVVPAALKKAGYQNFKPSLFKDGGDVGTAWEPLIHLWINDKDALQWTITDYGHNTVFYVGQIVGVGPLDQESIDIIKASGTKASA